MFDPLSNFKLNKILSAVNALPTTLASSFTEVKNAIAGVDEKVVYNGEGIDDLKANTLLNAGSVVKSVQRGNAEIDKRGYVKIPISYVNIAKSILYVVPQVDSGDFKVFVYIANDGNNIEVINYLHSDGVTTKGNFSWQVIEFY